MRTIETTIYKFSELSDAAKERARGWYRGNGEWLDYDFVYDDAASVADILGFDIRQTRKTLNDGTVRYDPTIYWSGFSYQGDGACFEGTYRYKKGCSKAIKAYAPNDETLHDIAAQLTEMQRKWFYQLSGDVKHRGHYYHEYCMECALDHPSNSGYGETPLPEDEFKEICADFARWIYRQMEREYEWQMSNEAVDESIEANEYEFTEEGKIV